MLGFLSYFSTRKKFMLYFIFVILIFFTIFITKVSLIKTTTNFDQSQIDIIINFIVPIKKDNLDTKITILPEIPSTSVPYDIKRLNSRTIILHLKPQGYPQGQLISFKIEKVNTVLPFIKKSVSGKVRPKVSLKILSSNLGKISSRGPVPINFNTLVNPKSLKDFSIFPVSGNLIASKTIINGKSYTDPSKWLYYPDNPFTNNKTYRIFIKSGLKSLGGSILEKDQEIVFTTAVTPRVIKTIPAQDSKQVQLYRNIEFLLDQEMKDALVEVTDSSGRIYTGTVKISKKKVVFQPAYAFLPNKSYIVKLIAESQEHEPIKHEYFFKTLDMGKRIWVDVKLGTKHEVRVYQGNKLIRYMLTSGGKADSPTPLGYFYTKDRGYSFWSPRFGEGATYWVRLVDQILVHSVPRDSSWTIKEDEHTKLGLPASHGCLRLNEKDAKWFYENIPRGTLVIIHK